MCRNACSRFNGSGIDGREFFSLENVGQGGCVYWVSVVIQWGCSSVGEGGSLRLGDKLV